MNSGSLDTGSQQPTRIRHVIVLVATMMSILLYLDRFCVSFAVEYIREDLSLTQNQMSWFLSAFFWSYALAQVPSGWLSDRFGARIMLVIYILTWSFFTGLIGASTTFTLLLFTRLGCGLGQAGAYPTSASVVSKWVPFSNRGTASSIIAFGGRIGGAIAPVLTALLIVLFVPFDTPTDLQPKNLLNVESLSEKLISGETVIDNYNDAEATNAHVWGLLDQKTQTALKQLANSSENLEANREQLATGLNQLMASNKLYSDFAFQEVKLPKEGVNYVKRVRAGDTLEPTELKRFNRFLLEGHYRNEIGKLYVKGWRPVMFVYGFAGLFVAGLFWFFFRDRPDIHPWCNKAEQDLIASGRPPGAPSPHGKAGKVPLMRIIKSRSMFFICLAQVGTNIGWVFLVTWLPRYLADVHQVPILERGFMSMVPIAVGFLGMLAGGMVTDALVPRIGLRWGRRLPLFVTRFTAAAGYGIVLWLASQPSGSALNQPWFFVAAFSIVAFSTDMGSPATWAFKQDVGGRYVGSILGWGNMWGNLGAAVSPPIYDYFLGETPAIADWNNMFLVCLGAFVIAGLCTLGVDATIPIAPPDDDDDDADHTEENAD